MKTEEKFKAKMTNSGNSKVITVPRYLIKNNKLDPTKKYNVILKEVS